MAYLQNGLYLHYQPIFDSQCLSPLSVEALLRPSYAPERDNGNLFHGVFMQAMQDLPVLRNSLNSPDLRLQINITANDIVTPSFPAILSKCLAATGVEAGAIILELTEHFGIVDVDRTQKNMAQCVARGVEIYLDDFGSGYSNIEWFLKLPVSGLKFDRTIVSKYQAKKNMVLLEHLCAMSKELGWKTTAEGVENMADVPRLAKLGVDALQGYALCKPAAIGQWDSALLSGGGMGAEPH